jgi:sugar/nucleoside kinase (ribokinase family)
LEEKPVIVALGDLMLDIASQTKDPILYGTDSFVQAALSPGGSAANFAVWAARLGADVGLIAKVGDDVLGHSLLQDLEREGVATSVATGKETTGFTHIIVDRSGERTMLAARGANTTLGVDDLDWELLDRSDLLHVSAYVFLEETPRHAASTAMAYAKERGKLLSLDPSAHGHLPGLGPEGFLSLAKGVDLLFPNLDEGRALTGEQEPERVVRHLLQHFAVVVLKMGAEGAMAGTGDTIINQRGFEVPVVDTTGAGDAFAAAFVVEWLAHQELAAALREGNRVAAGVIQAVGARFTATPPDASPR